MRCSSTGRQCRTRVDTRCTGVNELSATRATSAQTPVLYAALYTLIKTLANTLSHPLVLLRYRNRLCPRRKTVKGTENSSKLENTERMQTSAKPDHI